MSEEEFEMSEMLVGLACTLINHRINHNLSQEEFSRKSGMSLSAIIEIENGGDNDEW